VFTCLARAFYLHAHLTFIDRKDQLLQHRGLKALRVSQLHGTIVAAAAEEATAGLKAYTHAFNERYIGLHVGQLTYARNILVAHMTKRKLIKSIIHQRLANKLIVRDYFIDRTR